LVPSSPSFLPSFLLFITHPSPQHKSEEKQEKKAASEKRAATTARNKKNKVETTTKGDSDADFIEE
jgi:hypothetical protein